MEKEQNKKKDSILAQKLAEIFGSVIFEIFWRIASYIPRMIVSMFKNI